MAKDLIDEIKECELQAEKTVVDAEKKAEEIINKAKIDGDRIAEEMIRVAKETADKKIATADNNAYKLRQKELEINTKAAEELKENSASKIDEAVKLIVKGVIPE